MMRLLLTCALWIIPVSGWAAIAHDATTTHTSNNVTTVSGSHTPTSTTNGVALICVSWQRGTLGTLNTVTYGGNSATFIAGQTDGGGQRRIELWQYVGYGSGASTVTATFDAIKNDARMHVSTYTGVNQSSPLGTAVTAGNATATITVDVSSATGELVADCAMGGSSAAAGTVGAGQTQRANFGDVGNHLHFGSDESGATTTTMSWSITSDFWATVAVPLKPATAGRGNVRLLMGVGQ